MEQLIELVKRAKAKDATAFAGLYELLYKDLYRFALYTLKNKEDAEDIVSETVMDAYASIQKLRQEEAFKAWIFRILTNKCKNRLKEYSKKTVDLEEVENLIFQEEEMADTMHIREIFAQLSDEERLIISMHVFGGYHTREIASILHMNHNTVRTKESRAYRKLAQKLNSQEVFR